MKEKHRQFYKFWILTLAGKQNALIKIIICLYCSLGWIFNLCLSEIWRNSINLFFIWEIEENEKSRYSYTTFTESWIKFLYLYRRKRPKVDASIFDSSLGRVGKKGEENSVSTFGRFRLLTSFEYSPVSVKLYENK